MNRPMTRAFVAYKRLHQDGKPIAGKDGSHQLLPHDHECLKDKVFANEIEVIQCIQDHNNLNSAEQISHFHKEGKFKGKFEDEIILLQVLKF